MQVADRFKISPRDVEEWPATDFLDAQEYVFAQAYLEGAFDDPPEETDDDY